MNFQEAKKILIFAPHPCDEILGCSGVIKAAVDRNIPYRIVFATAGEADFWGRIINWCQNNLEEYHCSLQNVLRVGATKYITQDTAGLRVQAIVYVEDRNGHPMSDYKLVILNENPPKVFYTNELGWAVTDISPANLFPLIAGVDGFEFTLKRRFNPMENDGYGEKRIQESREALKELGVTPEHILFWDFRDATLFKLADLHPETYASFMRKIREILAEFSEGLIFIPHLEDADPDHRALAQMILMLKDKYPNLTAFQYLINLTEDHRRWPLPPFQKSFLDRLSPVGEIALPEKFDKEEVFSLHLEKVGLDCWKKLRLVQKFRTQLSVDECGFRYSFVKRNELFFR